MAPAGGRGRLSGPGWRKAAVLGLALGAFGAGLAPPAAAQATLQVTAQVVSVEPISQGLAEAAGLVAEAGSIPWSLGARAETRLAVVTRSASPTWRLPGRGRVWLDGAFLLDTKALLPPEPVTLTIAFLRN